jgi:hypothetical protein
LWVLLSRTGLTPCWSAGLLVCADIVHDTGVDGYLKNPRFLAALIDSASTTTPWQRTRSAALSPETKVLSVLMLVKSHARF